MDAIQPLLIVIAIQLALACIGWWLAGTALGLSRPAAMHWAGFCLCGLVPVAVALLHANPRQALPQALANVGIVLAAIALSRGVTLFFHQRAAGWPDALAVALVALVGMWDVLLGLDPNWRSVLVSGTVAVMLLRGGLRNAHLVRAEFGAGMACLVGGPMLVTACLFGWRFVRGVWMPVPDSQVLMNAPTGTNVVSLLVLATLITLFNLTLAALVVTRLVRRLHHMSRHDSLTKLLNRRALMAALGNEQGRVRRGGGGWALLLVDVDHFKRVNDQHGHAVGDEVLCRVASVLRRSAREVDTVARMGGEEFCVLAPLTDLHGAALLGERLRQAVAASADEPGAVPVTISVGVALSLPPAEAQGAPETAEAALARADVALYRAKAAGRDRVELPGETTALPPAHAGA